MTHPIRPLNPQPQPQPQPGEATSAGLEPDPSKPRRTALVIRGTANDDDITVSTSSRRTLLVTADGVTVGAFSVRQMWRIIVLAGDGNDRVELAAVVKMRAILDGGTDDDVLIAGRGRDMLIGGVGADVFTGGTGIDSFVGDDLDTVTDRTRRERLG